MLSYKQKKKTRLLSSCHKMISSIFSTGTSYYLNGSVLLAGVGISIDGTSSCKSNNVGKYYADTLKSIIIFDSASDLMDKWSIFIILCHASNSIINFST